MQTYMSLRASLNLDSKTARKFDTVNPHLINQVAFICAVAFGIPSGGAGLLGCAIIGAAAGGYGLGEIGKLGGEWAAEKIYEWLP